MLLAMVMAGSHFKHTNDKIKILLKVLKTAHTLLGDLRLVL